MPEINLQKSQHHCELCRREGIAHSIYYKWSKAFMGAGKWRLAGDTAWAASTGEVNALRREARELKGVVAEQTLELRLLKMHKRRRGRRQMRYLKIIDRKL